MSTIDRRQLQTAMGIGMLIATVGLAAASLGAGMTGFWIAVLVGVPLSLLAEYRARNRALRDEARRPNSRRGFRFGGGAAH